MPRSTLTVTSSVYTSDELSALIKAIDVKLTALLITRSAPAEHWSGKKKVDYGPTIRGLQEQRKLYVAEWMAMNPDAAAECWTSIDYEVDSTGAHLHDTIGDSTTSEGFDVD